MHKHLPAALSIARRHAKRYAEGGTVDLPEIKVTPPPPMVSDEDLSMAEVPQAKSPREGGLMQTIPKFAELLGSPEGRGKLWDAASQLPANIWGGVKEQVSGPGEAMAGHMTPVQEADWATSTALGLGGSELPISYTRPGIGVFGGRGSALADHAALAEAEALEQKGLNQNQIHFRTGWFRDQGTGEWMYHHNMKDAALGPAVSDLHADRDMPIQNSSKYIRPGESHTLDKVLQHPDLYEAYPLLKDWKVIPNDVPGQMGSVNYADKTMKIAPQNKEAMLGTLTHEANHIIQAYEGFSRGSSVNRWLPAEYPAKMQELWQQATPFNQWIESQGLPVGQAWKAIQKAKEDPGMLNDWDRSLVSNFTQAGRFDEALELFKKQELLNKALNEAFDKYIHVYGEAMSRQSEYRRTLTPEESRRITVPNAMRMLEQNPVDPKELIYNTNPLTPTDFPTARERGAPSPYDIEESYRISPEGFYTRADRVVDEKGPKAATADEWLSFLKNQQISPKEDQYIGISNWLKQEGEQRSRPGSNRPLKISKEELQEHIQANSPKLGTYMATGRSLPTHLPEEWGGNPQNMWEEERPPELEPDWGPNDFQAPQEEAYGSDTRYSDMVIPGGKNYSEIKLRYFPKEIGKGFYSEHFPHDQDLMGAVRADERKINGKNTFHMHEMQSDWHQMGSKAGYNRVTSKEELEAASDRLDIAHEHANSFHGYERSPEAEEARAVLGERQQEYNRLIASSRSPIPDAPFKQTWDDLLFKQVLRHAVEKGFDQVSWPGSAETIRKTEQWPTLEEKEGKYLTGRATDVTSVIRRYLSALPELGNKLGKKYGTQVGVGQSQPKLGYTVHTLPLTPAFKKAIMDEGFAFKYQKGGKVEQKRMYTMPLKPGSRKTASGFKRGGAIKDAVSIARRMCRG